MEEAILENTDKKPYLSFILGDENFAVHVNQVKEIIELYPFTRIPHSPDYLKGIINLRGSIVPVVDLRIKFGLEEVEKTKKTRIIIFELQTDEKNEKQVLGGIVDQTHDVLSVDETEFQDPPSLSENENAEYIKAIFKHEDQFFMILEINKVLSKEELKEIIESDS